MILNILNRAWETQAKNFFKYQHKESKLPKSPTYGHFRLIGQFVYYWNTFRRLSGAHLDQGQGVELVQRVNVSLQELEVLHVGEGLAESWQVGNL